MNYKRIYESLIQKAKARIIDGYTETHHIIPRCLGGSDDSDNLVELTPEEHYVAHQLLVKIYPNNHRLIYAANMMITNRPNNKMYGWLKRKFSNAISENQTGVGNSQHGTKWIYNDTIKVCKKINKNDKIPDGWLEGRKIKWNEHLKYCLTCGKQHKNKMYCSPECFGKRKIEEPTIKDKFEEIYENYKITNSIYKSLSNFGYCGTGSNYRKFKNFIKSKTLL